MSLFYAIYGEEAHHAELGELGANILDAFWGGDLDIQPSVITEDELERRVILARTRLRKMMRSSFTPWESRTSIAFRQEPPVATLVGSRPILTDLITYPTWGPEAGHIARRYPRAIWRTALLSCGRARL